MYIQSVKIKNIRSITEFEMTFDKPAGWHVLIGDNGAGKSSIIRSIAVALIGPDEIYGIQPNWNEWLQWKTEEAIIEVKIKKSENIDVQNGISGLAKDFTIKLELNQNENGYVTILKKTQSQAKMSVWGGKVGWFSAGYGPFRRFTGGSPDKDKIFENETFSRLASHLSLFGEDVALTEAIKWLNYLHIQTLEKKISENVLENLTKFINSHDFLPHNAHLESISSDGIIFKDGNGAEITVNQMSDGYRSILSLTFELLRQMIRVYGSEVVLKQIKIGNMIIDVPGVVLIDEVDAHFHPTWQTRIGQWFTKYFPNIQFIVTTHSPLVCRACYNGSIWRLAAPGSGNESGEIIGDDKKKLIYGNVLDAYETEIFGENISISEQGSEKMFRLAELNNKSMKGRTTDIEEKELSQLKSFLTPVL